LASCTKWSRYAGFAKGWEFPVGCNLKMTFKPGHTAYNGIKRHLITLKEVYQLRGNLPKKHQLKKKAIIWSYFYAVLNIVLSEGISDLWLFTATLGRNKNHLFHLEKYHG